MYVCVCTGWRAGSLVVCLRQSGTFTVLSGMWKNPVAMLHLENSTFPLVNYVAAACQRETLTLRSSAT